MNRIDLPFVTQGEKEWEFPELHIGDRVLVAVGPQLVNPSFGVIANVENRTVDVWMLQGHRPTLLECCRHADDPQVPLNPLWFEDNANTGVFKLAWSEEITYGLARRLEVIEDALAPVRPPQAYRPPNETPESQADLRRGPGRPRKIVPEVPESA